MIMIPHNVRTGAVQLWLAGYVRTRSPARAHTDAALSLARTLSSDGRGDRYGRRALF